MTQTTIERESTDVVPESFVTLAEQVPTRQEMTELAERYVANPADRIKNQLDELVLLYDRRVDRTTDYAFNGRNRQFDMFATRDAAGEQLEEVYCIQSQYSLQYGDVRTYSVSVLEDGGESYRMTVQDEHLNIMARQGRSSVEITDPTLRQQYIEDFIWRSIVATIRTTERDPEEREAADLDALIKLQTRLYQGRKVATSVDL